MKSVLSKIWPFLVIVLTTLFLFRDVLFLPSGKMIFGGDIFDAYFFWKTYLRQSFLAGQIPFWNPYNFSGTPFLAHPNINIFYPPNWLFIFLPPNFSFSWYFFIHIIIAGTNMYFLSRKYTDKISSLAAGCVYAFGGFFMARIYAGHLEYVDAASWVPLAYLAGISLINKPVLKNLILSALGFFILILCGNELFLLFTIDILFLYLIYNGLRNIRKIKNFLKSIFYLGLSIILGLGLASVEFLPRFEFMKMSIRSSGIPYSMASSGSLPMEGIRLFLNPFFWGSPFPWNYTYHGPWPNLFEFTHYCGVTTLLIIAGGFSYIIYKKFRRKKISSGSFLFYLAFAVPVFLIMSFGLYFIPNLHEIIWKYIPLYKGIRFPARHLFLVAFSISILTGMSVGLLKNKILKILLVMIISIDLVYFGSNFIKISGYPNNTFDTKLIEYLKKNAVFDRILPDYPVVSGVRKEFDFGAFSNERLFSTSDYNSMVISNYYDFIDILNKSVQSSLPYYNVEIPPPNPWSHYINYLNIKYVLSDRYADGIAASKSTKFTRIFEGKTYNLYENNEAKGRADYFDNIRIFPDNQSAKKAMLEENIDITGTLLIIDGSNSLAGYTPEKCTYSDIQNVEFAQTSLNSISIVVDLKCRGFLSISNVNYPGWKAKINGKAIRLYTANYAFMAVPVPEGKSRVEIFYSPDIYLIGGSISVLSVIILIIIYKVSGKYKNRDSETGSE